MQTFLPFPDFDRSARVLDRARLGKQRVEAYQILRTLIGETQGWKNHPVVHMWAGHEDWLFDYACAMCLEWRRRGYRDTVLDKLWSLDIPDEILDGWPDIGDLDVPPRWLGDEMFHASHRAALLAKDPKWYEQFGWTEEPKISYVWPRGGSL